MSVSPLPSGGVPETDQIHSRGKGSRPGVKQVTGALYIAKQSVYRRAGIAYN